MDTKGMIEFGDFMKLDLRVGLVEEVEDVEESDKLLRMQVRFGENDVKTVFAGVKKWYSPGDLRGKKLGFVYNLEPRKMFGGESQAMMMALQEPSSIRVNEDGVEEEIPGKVKIWPVPEEVPVGSVIR